MKMLGTALLIRERVPSLWASAPKGVTKCLLGGEGHCDIAGYKAQVKPNRKGRGLRLISRFKEERPVFLQRACHCLLAFPLSSLSLSGFPFLLSPLCQPGGEEKEKKAVQWWWGWCCFAAGRSKQKKKTGEKSSTVCGLPLSNTAQDNQVWFFELSSEWWA